MHDDSLIERGRAKVWGASFVALLAGLIIALIYVEWTRSRPPAKERSEAAAKCRQAYANAVTGADTARVDAEVAIWRVARSTTRDVTCKELRTSADW